MQLRQDAPGYEHRRAAVFVVTTGSPQDTGEFCAKFGVPFACLVDHPGEPGYQAFGLEKVSLLRLFGPNPAVSLWTAVRRFSEISIPKTGDVYQMSGSFVIDAGGVLRMAHRSQNPGDHVANERVWAVLDSLRPSAP